MVLACLLTACAEEPPPLAEAVRAVKTVTVTEPASGSIRRFSGVVEAADSSNISFEVSGVVEELKVDVGDRVQAGQALAVLDKATYELNVEAAQASVRRAEAEFREADSHWERLQRIAREDIGATSEQALDQAAASRDSVRQNLSYTTSRLNLAKRDVERTVLYAPFDGIISERHVDAFEQVNRGQRVLSLFMEGAMEAAISIPESEIAQVRLGLHGDIRFPSIPGEVYDSLVTEVSEVAGTANAFPVRLTINSDNERVRPGITVEVTLMLGDESTEQAFLVPLRALASSAGKSGSHVFKFDAKTSTVKRTVVKLSDVRDNDVVVEDGLEAGDVIVVAGVSFLRDGQKVRLMQ